MMNSDCESIMCLRMPVSTTAPKLSTLETKRYSLPALSNRSTSPEAMRAS